ncbi:hypothetical protein R1flu_000020 [Riccia fluitans]|uniref:Uncharacterized protein n=1 Tax=Riccia fluitans TaxID=41844 RepID=A0ABD1XZA9_9MARC
MRCSSGYQIVKSPQCPESSLGITNLPSLSRRSSVLWIGARLFFSFRALARAPSSCGERGPPLQGSSGLWIRAGQPTFPPFASCGAPPSYGERESGTSDPPGYGSGVENGFFFPLRSYSKLLRVMELEC